MLKRHSLLAPLLSKIVRATFNMQSAPGCQNISMLKTAYQAQLCCTFDLLERLGHSNESTSFRLNLLCNTLCDSDPMELLNAMKNAYDALIDMISGKVVSSYIDFKGRISEDALLAEALVAPVNKVLSVVCDADSNYDNRVWSFSATKEAEALAQYFGFLTKLELSNTTLEEKALADYILVERDYPSQCEDKALVARLRDIIARRFKAYEYHGGLEKHGNGSVANRIEPCLVSKYQAMADDQLLRDGYELYTDEEYANLSPLPICRDLERCSRLTFVPKNVSKLRSISMEPAMLQYCQQGVMKSLYDFFRTDRFYRRHIRLEDQSLNQTFAYVGSTTDFYSTLDLSAASDSVGLDLAIKLFSGVPKLLKWLIVTRSTHTELPDGTRLLLKKFAPMGSACCFPVETIIFAACAELAIELAGDRPDYGVPKSLNVRHFCVYGDDIIVPHYAYDSCVEILTCLGFKVNQDKSFHHSPFKESCGVNFLAGHDITPLKWKGSIYNRGGSLTPEGYETLCSYANNAYVRGLKAVRCFVLELIQRNGKTPFFGNSLDKLPQVYSPCPTNFHCKQVRSGRGYENTAPSSYYVLSNLWGHADKFISTRGIRKKGDSFSLARCATLNNVPLRPDYQGNYALVTGAAVKATEESTDIDDTIRLYESLRAISNRDVSTEVYNLNASIETVTTHLFGERVASITTLVFDVESPISATALRSCARRFTTRLQPLWV